MLGDFFNKLGKKFATVADTGKKYLGKGLGIFNQAKTLGKTALKDPLVAKLYGIAKNEFPALEGIESFIGDAGKGANYLGKLIGADNASITEGESEYIDSKLGNLGNKVLGKRGGDFDLTDYIRKKRQKYSK